MAYSDLGGMPSSMAEMMDLKKSVTTIGEAVKQVDTRLQGLHMKISAIPEALSGNGSTSRKRRRRKPHKFHGTDPYADHAHRNRLKVSALSGIVDLLLTRSSQGRC